MPTLLFILLFIALPYASSPKPELNNNASNVSTRINDHVPPIKEEISQCIFRPVHWANFTSASVALLGRHQANRLFENSIRVTGANRVASAYKRLEIRRKPSCYLLFIYSPDCPFSVSSLPFVKALARAYPQLPTYAVRVTDYVSHRWSLRVLFVPKLKIIVNGRIFREYTRSDTNLNSMIDFVWSTLHILPKGPVALRTDDFKHGFQIPPEAHSNPLLVLGCWLITLGSMCYLLVIFRADFCRHLAEWLNSSSHGNHERSPSSHGDTSALQTWEPGQMIPASNDLDL